MGEGVNYTSRVLNFRHVIVALGRDALRKRVSTWRILPLDFDLSRILRPHSSCSPKRAGMERGDARRVPLTARKVFAVDTDGTTPGRSSDPNTRKVYDRSSPSLKRSINPLSRGVLEYRNNKRAKSVKIY